MSVAGPLDLGGLHFVEASAGTGKTHQLAGRVVELVAVDGLAIERIAVVTFTRAAAAELRERIRARLVECRRRLAAAPSTDADGGDVPGRLAALMATDDPRERSNSVSMLTQAIADIDRAVVTTIHGFCQHVLAGQPMTSPAAAPGAVAEDLADVIRSATIDAMVARLLPGPRQWSDDVIGGISVDAVAAGVDALFNNPRMELRPRSDDPTAPELALGTVDLINDVADQVESRLERAGRMGHHHLLTRAHDAVRSDPTVLTELRERFAIVLIDEFQDTDALQWSIFSTVFLDGSSGHGVVAVGDPKQAIYSFRGGDVGTYLAARRHREVRSTGHLSTNFRSDGAMVAAFNTLFDGVSFGGLRDGTAEDRIVHADVEATERNSDGGLVVDDHPLPPVRVRVAAPAGMNRTRAGTLYADDARRMINADVAATVSRLLTSGTEIVEGDERHQLDASRIAVLCRGRRDCRDVHAQLTRIGIPAVIAGAWSVTDTDAVTAVGELLWALASPGTDGRLRRVAMGPLVRAEASELSTEGSTSIAELHDALVSAVTVLAEQGVSAMYRDLRTGLDLPATLLAQPGGDRMLVDVEHLIELLASETGDRGTSPLDLRSALADLVLRGGGDGQPGDLYRRRTPADGAAVQIMTIHASKGLEFDVVLCPTLFRAPGTKTPFRYYETAPDGTRTRIYDVRKSERRGGAPDDAIEAARDEERDEARRTGYVAITRARHHCVLWYGAVDKADISPLGTFLGLDGAGVAPDDNELVTALRLRLAGAAFAGRALFDVSAIEATATSTPMPGPPVTPGPPGDLRTATFDRVLGRVDGRWSFSRLTHQTTSVQAAAEDDPDDDTLGDAGPRDEGPRADIPLADVGMGTEFGTLVHETLERVDLSTPELREELSASLVAVGGPAADDERHRRIVEGLVQSALTPLGPLFDDARLVDIGPADHLDEADFEFSLPTAAHAVTAARLADLIADHLPDDDPLAPWARRLAAGSRHIELGGFMVGSIDGLFRVTTTDSPPRFVVVDYKTNWLGRRGEPLSLDDYAPARLPDAMAHHNYPLQALIYAVATHRFLRWRMADYDPSTHLGGAAYLFLRGMIGAETPRAGDHPYGVFSWRQPAELVVDASDVLSDLGAGEPT